MQNKESSVIATILRQFEFIVDHSFYYKIFSLPFLFWWILFAAVFFTIRLGFPFFRFGHALKVVKGHYDNPTDPGTITHRDSVLTACLGTVGLGSVGGMGATIANGGAGTIFWMIVFAPLMMSLKCVEVYFGHKYRVFDGKHFKGGVCYYVNSTIGDTNPKIASYMSKIYAITFLFAVMLAPCFLQTSQATAAICDLFSNSSETSFVVSAIAIAVALIVIPSTFSEIKVMSAIGKILTPLMMFLYVAWSVGAIFVFRHNIPAACAEIVSSALNKKAIFSGGAASAIAAALGRIIFTTECASGSSAMAHAATKTRESMREGFASMVEFCFPFAICLVTGFVIVITGANTNFPDATGLILTKRAFASALGESITSVFFAGMIPLLALTTMALWGFYGQTVWRWAFDRFADKTMMLYRVLYTIFAVAGVYSYTIAKMVYDLADFSYNLSTFINTIVLFFISNEAAREMRAYNSKTENK